MPAKPIVAATDGSQESLRAVEADPLTGPPAQAVTETGSGALSTDVRPRA